jgi:hypothetical protein
MPTYRVSVWDCELCDGQGGWEGRYAGLPKWGIRAALRELATEGWVEDFSMLVEREGVEDVPHLAGQDRERATP